MDNSEKSHKNWHQSNAYHSNQWLKSNKNAHIWKGEQFSSFQLCTHWPWSSEVNLQSRDIGGTRAVMRRQHAGNVNLRRISRSRVPWCATRDPFGTRGLSCLLEEEQSDNEHNQAWQIIQILNHSKVITCFLWPKHSDLELHFTTLSS